MTKVFLNFAIAASLFGIHLQLKAQSQGVDALPDSPGQMARANSGKSVAGNGGAYQFPSARRQFGNYVFSIVGPPGIIASAIGAGLDQRKPEPDTWDSGAEGYGQRFGSRFGMRLMSQTTAYTLGAAFHEDVTYHRCECNGFFRRTTHAFTSTVISRTRSGGKRLSVPLLVSPYAGSFGAVSAWYPDRYGPSDAARLGSTAFLFRAAGNLVGEFLAPPR